MLNLRLARRETSVFSFLRLGRLLRQRNGLKQGRLNRHQRFPNRGLFLCDRRADRRKRLLTMLTFSFSLFAPSGVWGTSVQQLDFSQLVEKAEMVFEGKVVASQTRWNAIQTEIVTEIEFDVVDVIKGNYAKSSLTLEFLGGQVGEQTMMVQSMVYPKVGEQGIYFVESLSAQQVNPLLGWNQGHFLVQGERMMTNAEQPVIAIETSARSVMGKLSDGQASGVIARKQSKKGIDLNVETDALSVQSFKDAIKQVSDHSND